MSEQRFCVYKNVAGPKKGKECGRFVRSRDKIVCGVHRRFEDSVAAMIARETRAKDKDVVDAVVLRQVDIEPQTLVETRSIAVTPSVARPLSPTRFRGVLPKNREILGDDAVEALGRMTPWQVKDHIKRLETDTFNDTDPITAQAMYEELLRLMSALTQ